MGRSVSTLCEHVYSRPSSSLSSICAQVQAHGRGAAPLLRRHAQQLRAGLFGAGAAGGGAGERQGAELGVLGKVHTEKRECLCVCVCDKTMCPTTASSMWRPSYTDLRPSNTPSKTTTARRPRCVRPCASGSKFWRKTTPGWQTRAQTWPPSSSARGGRGRCVSYVYWVVARLRGLLAGSRYVNRSKDSFDRCDSRMQTLRRRRCSEPHWPA